MKIRLLALPLQLALLGASCEPQASQTPAADADTRVATASPGAATSPPAPSIQPVPVDPASAPPQTTPVLIVPVSKAVATPATPPQSSADTVDYTCKTSADCAVKNVGNCCGQYPACVNKGSRTFPDQVRAQCARERMDVCGFPAIHGCECVAGKCEGQTGVESNSPIAN